MLASNLLVKQGLDSKLDPADPSSGQNSIIFHVCLLGQRSSVSDKVCFVNSLTLSFIRDL